VAAAKSEARNSKSEMVRLAHYPEPSRRANPNDENLVPGRTEASAWDAEATV